MPDWTSGAVMLTYTLGQGLLVYGIVSALRARANFGKVTPGGVAEASVGSAG